MEDVSLMRTLPNMTVVQPADAVETRGAVKYIARHEGQVFLSVQDFTESGDTQGLYQKYGLSAEHVSAAALELAGLHS